MSKYAKAFADAGRTGGGFGTCTQCKRRSAADEQGLCRACAYVKQYDAGTVAARQIGEGVAMLRASDGAIRWPYKSLDEVVGPIPLGHVVYLVGASGLGKTTVAINTVRKWVTQANPIGVTVLPLETTPGEWRMAYAAVECGINHGDVFEMATRFHEGDTSVYPDLKRIEETMFNQTRDPHLSQYLEVIEDATVTVEGLDRACAIAASRGHKVVLVDHIDHVVADEDDSGRRTQGLALVQAVNDAALAYAKYYKLVLVLMSQANMSVQGDGSNPLARFQRLQMKHVMYNSFKVKNAAQIISTYRPLRVGTTRHDFNLARSGVINPMDVLADNRIGLSAMKLRHRGRNEGRTVEMGYEHGQMRDLTPDETQKDAIIRSMSDPLSHTSPVFTGKKKKGSE